MKYFGKRLTKRSAPFDLFWVKKLHREMLGEVWKWAGEFRRADIDPKYEKCHQIEPRTQCLLDDLKSWQVHGDDLVEQATTLHYRDRNLEIQTIINDVAAIYAPFDVQVQQISGVGNYDTGNGNTTVFVGADANDVDSSGLKYSSSFTPFIFCDGPGATKGYNHLPHSDPYNLAFADPLYQQQAGGTMLIKDDSQIADGIAHEPGTLSA